MGVDALGRPEVSAADLERIRLAFAQVPEGKRGAFIVIADRHGVRGHVAARLDGHWKVAAGAGVPLSGPPDAYVAVQCAW